MSAIGRQTYGVATPLIAPRYAVPRVTNSSIAAFAFFVAHIPLAVLMRQYPIVGLMHALSTLGIGLWWTTSKNHPERVAFVGAYILGAEVLWRLTRVPIFWEFGKYSVVGIFLVSMLVRRRFKVPILPLLYFALLLVSVAITSSGMDFRMARQQISFNLSGPLALMVSACFFSQLELTEEQTIRLFAAAIGPIVGIASVALLSTLTAQQLTFTANSNFVTSGGFGPNQVSAALGLGALMSYLCILHKRCLLNLRALLLVTVFALGAQSALTFSRSGLYIAVASGLAGSFCLITSNRGRITLIIVGAVLLLTTHYVVLPRLESLTRGVVRSRFESTKSTGRDRLAAAELEAWQESPIFGLGPGGAESFRHQLLPQSVTLVASHTEYTRMLAEHGIFGINALLLLVAMAVRNFRRAKTVESRMLVTSFVVWTFLFLATNAMRLVAPSFMFGLAFVTLISSEGTQLARGQAARYLWPRRPR